MIHDLTSLRQAEMPAPVAAPASVPPAPAARTSLYAPVAPVPTAAAMPAPAPIPAIIAQVRLPHSKLRPRLINIQFNSPSASTLAPAIAAPAIPPPAPMVAAPTIPPQRRNNGQGGEWVTLGPLSQLATATADVSRQFEMTIGSLVHPDTQLFVRARRTSGCGARVLPNGTHVAGYFDDVDAAVRLREACFDPFLEYSWTCKADTQPRS